MENKIYKGIGQHVIDVLADRERSTELFIIYLGSIPIIRVDSQCYVLLFSITIAKSVHLGKKNS